MTTAPVTADIDLFADEVLSTRTRRTPSSASSAGSCTCRERRVRAHPLRAIRDALGDPGDLLLGKAIGFNPMSTRRSRAPRWRPTRRCTPSCARR